MRARHMLIMTATRAWDDGREDRNVRVREGDRKAWQRHLLRATEAEARLSGRWPHSAPQRKRAPKSPRARGERSVTARLGVRCSCAWDARGRTGRPLKGSDCPGPAEGRLRRGHVDV